MHKSKFVQRFHIGSRTFLIQMNLCNTGLPKMVYKFSFNAWQSIVMFPARKAANGLIVKGHLTVAEI